MQKRREEKQLVALMIQNNPKILEKTQNIKFCRKMIQNQKEWKNYQQKSIQQLDLIMFPQMAFTGYNFKDYNHVLPMACFRDQGQEFQFARQLAQKYKCYVLFGYIEKQINQKKGLTQKQFRLYNSAALLDRSGKLLLNTRKSHLYFCDQLWAEQGQGFKSIQIINKYGKSINCAIGICMDINQKNFSSKKYELADFIKQKNCEALLFISNWTDTSPKTNKKQQLLRMLNYWLHRLSPLLQQQQPQRLFFISDRVGTEYNYYQKQDSWFFGCSGGLNLNPPEISSILDKKQQKCILIRGKLQVN